MIVIQGREFRTWGPSVSRAVNLRSEQVVELIAERSRLRVELVADALLAARLERRYVLMESLADTRRTMVFAAVDLVLGREVALKIHCDVEDQTSHRALVEVRAASRVDHANVVRVLDAGEHEGQLYAVMELCEMDLGAWSVGRSWREIIERILEAGAGLEALHAAGLVHGDVKPPNILVKDGVAKLADLELAGPPGQMYRISGTTGFIAPEVADGLRVESGDLFGLACSAWFCLFGNTPFGVAPAWADASSAVLVLVERTRAGELELPAQLPVGLDARVLGILRAGLEPDLARRPSLRRWLAELDAVRARPRSVRVWLRRFAKRDARP